MKRSLLYLFSLQLILVLSVYTNSAGEITKDNYMSFGDNYRNLVITGILTGLL
jgi:hypothetical protein